MLGSGIFVLPGLAFEMNGKAVWLAYLLASICVLPAAISKSELATAMPTSGGTYVYLERTFGPLAGTVAGFGLWVSILLKASFALMGFGAYLSVVTDYDIKYLALGLTFIITFLNIFGVGKVSGFLIFIVGLATVSLLFLDATILLSPLSQIPLELFPNGIDGLVECTALVFVSYAGVTKVAAIAEEIKNPEKNLPRGIMFSLLLVTAIYCLTTFTLSKYLPLEQLRGNIKPIYTMALAFGGTTFSIIIAILAILTMTSMANAGLLAGSRFPFAMSRDHLIPHRFGILNQKFLTPVWSILLSGCLIAFFIMTMDVTKIAKLASAFIIMIYLFENLAVIFLRETRVQWYKPQYKSKFYPYTQIIGILSSAGLLYYMGSLAFKGVMAISIPAIVLFVFYSRKRTTRKGVVGIRGKRADLVEEDPQSSAHLETMDLSRDASVVVALLGKERSPEMLIEMGTSLLDEGPIEVAHLTEAPEQTDLDDFYEESAELKSLRRRVIAMAVEKGIPTTFDPVVSHDISKTIYDISQRLHCKWLLLEWAGKDRGTFTLHNPIGWLKTHLQCNLMIYRDNGVRYVKKMLVILNYHPIDRLLIKTAEQIASANKADLTFALYTKPCSEANKEMLLDYINDSIEEINIRKSSTIVDGYDKIGCIKSASVEYDLMLIGATSKYSPFNLFGTEEDNIIAKSACSVLAVHSTMTSGTVKDE